MSTHKIIRESDGRFALQITPGTAKRWERRAMTQQAEAERAATEEAEFAAKLGIDPEELRGCFA